MKTYLLGKANLAAFLLLALIGLASADIVTISACNTTINSTNEYNLTATLYEVPETDCITFLDGANNSILHGDWNFIWCNGDNNGIVLNGTDNITIENTAVWNCTNGVVLDTNATNNVFDNMWVTQSGDYDFYCVTPDINFDAGNICSVSDGCDAWLFSCGVSACAPYDVNYYAIRGAWQTVPTNANGAAEDYVPAELGSPFRADILAIFGSIVLVAAVGAVLTVGKLGGLI